MNSVMFCIFDILFTIALIKIFMRLNDNKITDNIKIEIPLPQNKISRYFFKRGRK